MIKASEAIITSLNFQSNKVRELKAKFEVFTKTIVDQLSSPGFPVRNISCKQNGEVIDIQFCEKELFIVFQTQIYEGDSVIRGSINSYLKTSMPKESVKLVTSDQFNVDGSTEIPTGNTNEYINITNDLDAIYLTLCMLNRMLRVYP